MTRLVRAELRRLCSRRLTLFGLLGVALVLGLMMFAIHQETQPDRYVGAGFEVPPVSFAERLPNDLFATSILLTFGAFLIGAGFVGAEVSSGSLGTWLTFEPRRHRVYAGKLVALAVGALPAAALVLVAMVSVDWLIIDRHGSTAGMTADRWADFVWMGVRGVGLATAAAVLGAVLALLLKHTAAAFGVAVGYLVLVEVVFAGLIDEHRRRLIGLNVESWLRHGATYYQEDCQPLNGFCQSIPHELAFVDSAAYLTVGLGLLIALGWLVFRRRDIA